MSEITNANVEEMYDLNGVHEVVVQKADVGHSYLYALQLLSHGKDPVVLRARPGERFNKYGEELRLYGPEINPEQPAGGHTQTWEYAGDESHGNRNGEWFIGTKGTKYSAGYYWATQIARVKFSGASYKENTQLPRISNLNRAGRKFGLGYNGGNLVRSEAAVSPAPNYNYFLIVTIDSSHNGYFSLYNLSDVNNAINKQGTNDVNLKTNSLADYCLYAFEVDDLVGQIGSLQGFDIDDNMNIYVSSEASPTSNSDSKPRKIVKIPWGTTESYQWDTLSLDDYPILDESDRKSVV